MNVARFFVAVLVLAGALLAACSGNFGSGTTPPNGVLPSGNLAGINPTPTPTPNSANNILTYGSSDAFQPLPSVAGYGGAIAFPVPSPKPSGFQDIAVGATISVNRPSDAPDLNLATGGKKGKKRERPARALIYVTLLPTHDMTLSAYPRIAIDVPRDVVSVYRENEFGMALYNSGAKDTTFKLAVAELDTATAPPTASPNPSAPPTPTAIPVSATSSPSPSASPSTTPSAPASGVPTVRPSGASPVPAAPTPSATLPPQRITFAGTAAPLKLYANRAVVFALYALPVATSAPSAGGSPRAKESAAAAAAATSVTAAPSATPSATASASASAAAEAESAAATAAPK